MTKLRMEWPLPKAQPALVLTRADFETLKKASTNAGVTDANRFGGARANTRSRPAYGLSCRGGASDRCPQCVVLHRASCAAISNATHAPVAYIGRNHSKICASTEAELKLAAKGIGRTPRDKTQQRCQCSCICLASKMPLLVIPISSAASRESFFRSNPRPRSTTRAGERSAQAGQEARSHRFCRPRRDDR